MDGWMDSLSNRYISNVTADEPNSRLIVIIDGCNYYRRKQKVNQDTKRTRKILITLFLFLIAGLCEIGGGYLVWLWLREDMSWILGAIGGFILFLYGIVPTF